MRHENTSTLRHKDAPLLNTGELVIALHDYVRLREIVGDHDLAEELDRAIVVPSDRIQKNTVTMHSRVIYRDESTGTTREVELVYPDEDDPMTVSYTHLDVYKRQSLKWACHVSILVRRPDRHKYLSKL